MDDTIQPLPEAMPATTDDATTPAKAASRSRRGTRKPRRTTAKPGLTTDASETEASASAPVEEPRLAIAADDARPTLALVNEAQPPAIMPVKELVLVEHAPHDEQETPETAPAKRRRRRGGRSRKRSTAETTSASAEAAADVQPPAEQPEQTMPDAAPHVDTPAEKPAPAESAAPTAERPARASKNKGRGNAKTRPPVEAPAAAEAEPASAVAPQPMLAPQARNGQENGAYPTIALTAETPVVLLDAAASVLTPVPVMGELETQRSGRSRRRGGRGRHPVQAAPRPEAPAEHRPSKAPTPSRDEPKTDVKGRKLLVSVLPEEQVEVVVLEGGKVREYYIEISNQAKIRGNIYKGVISNIDTNLQAAFVNYGAVKNGFLQIDEIHPEYYLNPVNAGKGHKYPPIQKVLKPGQEVLVQVGKEPTGNKGAFLTTWISLAGRFLVLTPGQEQIGISRKVEDGEERNRLRELIKGLTPGEGLGAIVRTVSAGITKTTMQKDFNFLKRLWRDIRKKGMQEKAPALVYAEPGLAARAVRDYLTDDMTEIWVDDEATAAAMREMVSLLFPRKADLIKMHTDSRRTLLEKFDALAQIEQIHSREVNLPSGGRLVFDQTEALMAIDINSGKSGGNKNNFEGMAFRTNLEAAEVIPQQLRLRDIGGQIVIDFIEMRDQHQVREVEKTLRAAMKTDRARHDVGGMSSFGLLQIVRQRTGSSAISISMEACPFCQGTGTRRNMEWQAVKALGDLRRKMRDAHESGQTGLVYTVETELAWYLLNQKRERLTELEKDLGVSLEIRPGRVV